MIIYCIINKITKKKYIGQTIRTIQTRFMAHARYDKKSYIHRSIIKYGEYNFSIFKIDEACTREELNEKERYWIKLFNTRFPNGYNLTEGGDLPPNRKGIPFSTDHKKHLSENNGMHKKENRLKVSKGKLGRKRKLFSEQWKERIRQSSIGHTRHTEYQRTIISERMKKDNPMFYQHSVCKRKQTLKRNKKEDDLSC